MAPVGATQLPCGIVPEQVRVTAPVKPPRAPIVTVTLPVVPGVMGTVVGAVTVKSQPVPLKANVCGLPVALSAIESVPVRGLFDVELGAKLTVTEQAALTASSMPRYTYLFG